MSTLRSRVLANDEWFAHCGRLFVEGNRSNGQHARALREAAGVSLRALAKRMGISAPFLSDLERGNRQWSASICEKWEAAMSPTNDPSMARRDGSPPETNGLSPSPSLPGSRRA